MTSLARALSVPFLLVVLACCGAPQGETDTPSTSAEATTSTGPAVASETPAVAPTAAVAPPPPAEPYDPLRAPADVAAPPADAERTSSGLASKVLRPGNGSAKPGPTSEVTVHYSGWTTDGELFDSSHQRGQPATFPLNRVIDGWTEGLQLMVVGERRRFWIPADLAYGNTPGRPQGMLVFDVELLSFNP